jgi:hypothetical protein
MKRQTISTLLLIAFLAVGCASTEPSATNPDTTNATTGTTSQPPATTGPTPPAGGSVDGEVTVGGVPYAVLEILRCEPFTDHQDSLDLTAIGDDFEVFITIEHVLASTPQHSLTIQGAVAGGIFEESAMPMPPSNSWRTLDSDETLPGPPFEVAGNRINGSMSLTSISGGSSGVEVEFDLPIPEEIVDCSL